MEKKYYSEAAMAIHESANDLFEVGAISEAEMRDFNKCCFIQTPKTAHKKDETPVDIEHVSHVTA